MKIIVFYSIFFLLNVMIASYIIWKFTEEIFGISPCTSNKGISVGAELSFQNKMFP